jgi:hypothetical protein
VDNDCSFCHQSEACLASWTRALGAWSDRPAIKFGIAKQESADEIIVASYAKLNLFIITTYAMVT